MFKKINAKKSIGKYIGLIALSLIFVSITQAAPGDLDTTFSSDGRTVELFGFGRGGLYDTALQTDGKIVVVGEISYGISGAFGVARYNTDGSIDTSFDTDGITITPIGTLDFAESVAIQSDGKIVVVGTSNNSSASYFAVVRYNIDGSLDTTFDGDGVLTTSFTIAANAKSVAIQTDGKIVVAGSANSPIAVAVARYNSDGSLDTSFDSDGKVTTVITPINGFDRAYSVAIQSDGKIVAAGATTSLAPPLIDDVAIVRYNSDGSLDTSFDGDGIVITPVGSGADVAKSVKILPNGKIVIAGNSDNGISSDALLIRYNSDGSLDSSLWNPTTSLFGIGGIVTFDILDRRNDQINDLAIDSNGRYVIAGNKGGLLALARVLGDLAPSAANVSISGRVFAENNQGLRNAVVTLTDSSGQIYTTRTTTFGYFKFDEIEVGQTVIISVRSKRFQFDSQVISVNEQLEGLNFVSITENK